jgi:hypothetical protein
MVKMGEYLQPGDRGRLQSMGAKGDKDKYFASIVEEEARVHKMANIFPPSQWHEALIETSGNADQAYALLLTQNIGELDELSLEVEDVSQIQE